ncbi:SCP2 sterol-binding domain-containing protein [Stackebrandtia albiflava]
MDVFGVTQPEGVRNRCGTVRCVGIPQRTVEIEMATAEDCKKALERLAKHIAANNEKVKNKPDLDRRLACDITDLQISFHGRFSGGELGGIAEGDDPDAQIRLITGSDELVALVDGRLELGKAYASGKVKLKASLLDMLKLKKLM